MAVTLPGELVWVLNLLGFNWPEADEDKLRECAQHWREFASDVGHVRDDANRVAARVGAENQGASIDAFHTYWQGIGGGGGHLEEAQEAANLAADALDAFAVLIEGIKAAVIVQLGLLAAEIIADQLAAPETLGLSEGAAAGEVIVTRSIVRRLIDDGIQQVMREVVRDLRSRAKQIFASMLRRAIITGVMSTALDFGRQELDINVFHSRGGLSWQEMATSGGTGALFGALMPGHHDGGGAGKPHPDFMDTYLPSGAEVEHGETYTRIGSDDISIRVAQHAPPKEGFHDVVVHGNGADFMVDGLETNPAQIAQAVRENPNYVEGQPIRLLSCYSGNGPAQELADQLGASVIAPTSRIGTPRIPPFEVILDTGGEWKPFEAQTPQP